MTRNLKAKLSRLTRRHLPAVLPSQPVRYSPTATATPQARRRATTETSQFPNRGAIDVWLVNAEGELVRCNEGTAADLSKGPYVSFCVVDSLHKHGLKHSFPIGNVKATFEAMVRGRPLKNLPLGERISSLRSPEQALSEWLFKAYEVDPNTRLIRERSRSAIAGLYSGHPREDSSPDTTQHTQDQNGKARKGPS